MDVFIQRFSVISLTSKIINELFIAKVPIECLIYYIISAQNYKILSIFADNKKTVNNGFYVRVGDGSFTHLKIIVIIFFN